MPAKNVHIHPVVPYNPWKDPGLLNEIRKISANLCLLAGRPAHELSDVAQGSLLHCYIACDGDWRNKAYFIGAVEQAMKQHLADEARKSAPWGTTVALDAEMDIALIKDLSNTTAVALREALEKLHGECPDWLMVLAMYHFVGEDEPTIARKTGLSLSSVKRYRTAGLSAIGRMLGLIPNVATEESTER